MSTVQKVPANPNLVDPEDDLDDLDDVLDEFDTASPPLTTNKQYNRPRTNTRVDAPPVSVPGTGRLSNTANALNTTAEADNEEALSADFAKELAKGMENLMRDLMASDPLISEANAKGAKDKAATMKNDASTESEREAEKLLEAAWQKLLLEGVEGLAAEKGGVNGGVSSSTKSDEAQPSTTDFQQKIRQAAERLRESESNLKTESGRAAPNVNTLETLLSSLGDLGLGQGGDDEGELADFLENMMGQLLSKEILYEPLQELANSFPGYLANPPAPIPTEDRKRYDSQVTTIQKLLDLFNAPDYSDEDPAMSKKVSDLMTELQTFGQPPAEIMGDAGTSLTDDKCTIV